MKIFDNYINDGWLKIIHENFVALIFMHKWDYPTSHAHEDLGSMTLFYKGLPIIIDIGRYSYEKEKSFGLLPTYHNLFTIDNNSSITQKRGFYIQQYKDKCKVDIICDEENGFVDIIFNGFKRIDKSIVASRRLVFKNNIVEIIDAINSKNSVQVDTFFNFEVDSIKEIDNTYVLCKRDIKLNFTFSNKIKNLYYADNQNNKGWLYPNYGQKKECYSLHFQNDKSTRILNHYVIKEEK